MKKLFVVMFLGVLLVSPSITRAQSVNQQSIDDLRAELIALLVEQVAILQAQLDALQAQTQRTAEVNQNAGDTDMVLGSAPAASVTVEFGEEDEDFLYSGFCYDQEQGSEYCPNDSDWAYLTMSEDIDEAHLLVQHDGGKAEGSSFGKVRGNRIVVKNLKEGTYTYTFTGYQYGPSGRFDGVKAPFDGQTFVVEGSFEVK